MNAVRQTVPRMMGVVLLSATVAGPVGAQTVASGGGARDTIPRSPTDTTGRRNAAQLDTVMTQGRKTSEVGTATSSNQGTVGAADLALRPLLRPAEVVENVPE